MRSAVAALSARSGATESRQRVGLTHRRCVGDAFTLLAAERGPDVAPIHNRQDDRRELTNCPRPSNPGRMAWLANHRSDSCPSRRGAIRRQARGADGRDSRRRDAGRAERTRPAPQRPRSVISDLDTNRAANMLIERYDADAPIEAAQMIDRMLDRGDTDGRAVWQRIRRAIGVLQTPASGRAH